MSIAEVVNASLRPQRARPRPLPLRLAVLTGLVIVTALYGPLGVSGATAAPPQGSSGRVRAPELDGVVGYLNSAGPVRLQDLRGKIVLLDFWTLC